MIGGNNSREALQSILSEHPELANDSVYGTRPVSVYRDLSDDETLYLGMKHNRATHLVHEMTAEEKVCTAI